MVFPCTCRHMETCWLGKVILSIFYQFLFCATASDFLSTHSLGNEDISVPQAKRSRTDTDANVIDLSEEDQLKAAIAASISVNGNKSDSDDNDFVLVDSDDDESDDDCCLVTDVAKHSNTNTTLDPSRLAYLNMTKKLPSSTKEDKGKGSARRNTEKSLPMQKLSISENSSSSSSKNNSSGNILHLLLRLPSGGRMECSFHENHPIQVRSLYLRTM